MKIKSQVAFTIPAKVSIMSYIATSDKVGLTQMIEAQPIIFEFEIIDLIKLENKHG